MERSLLRWVVPEVACRRSSLHLSVQIICSKPWLWLADINVIYFKNLASGGAFCSEFASAGWKSTQWWGPSIGLSWHCGFQ